jgi:hypothetical protein
MESVKFDLLGEVRLDFDRFTVTHVISSGLYWPAFLRRRVAGRRVVVNEPVPYEHVEWVGKVVKHQWALLLLGVPFTFLGVVWVVTSRESAAVLAASIVWSSFLGLAPLLMVVWGRPYLGIIAGDRIITFPMDRQRDKVARALGLLRHKCRFESTVWRLDGTPFANDDALDLRPTRDRPFNQKRYTLILHGLGLLGVLGVLGQVEYLRPWAAGARALLLVAAIFWALIALAYHLFFGRRD